MLLPSNVHAERILLGGLLVRADRFGEFRDAVTTDDFSLEAHRTIWRSMVDCYGAGSAIDRVTLANSLLFDGKLDSVGGLSYIVSLDEGMPEVFNLGDYVRIVREKATARRVVLRAQVLIDEVLSGAGDIAEVIARADVALGDLAGALKTEREFFTPADVIEEAGGINAYLQARARSGLQSPWPRFNGCTTGLHPGDLFVLAANTGRGKTTFALNWALHAARAGCGVAVFSLEMARQQLADKTIALAGNFDSYALRRENPADMRHRIAEAVSSTVELPLYIRDCGTSVVALPAMVRRLRARIPIGLVIVDYLQLVKAEGRTRAEEVADVTRSLKNMAMELKIPVMALSQFSRVSSKEDGREPKLTDLKESSEIEQAANLVVFLHSGSTKDMKADAPVDVDVVIAKQRMGATLSLPFEWRRDTGVFTEK